MTRQSRSSWLGQFFRLHTPRKRSQRPKRVPAPLRTFWVDDGGERYRVQAYTKGEARAQAKKRLNCASLPREVEITEV